MRKNWFNDVMNSRKKRREQQYSLNTEKKRIKKTRIEISR